MKKKSSAGNVGGSPVVLPVRVWCGYRAAKFRGASATGGGGKGSGGARKREAFVRHVLDTFIPATVQMMGPVGLTAYYPAILPECPECLAVPDEVALVFYSSTEAYDRARTLTVAGRVYRLLHEVVFGFDATPNGAPPSFSSAPEAYGPGKMADRTSCYLFAERTAWREGQTELFVGVLPEGSQGASLASLTDERMKALLASKPKGLREVIFTTSRNCLVCWANWDRRLQEGAGIAQCMPKSLRSVLSGWAEKLAIPGSMWSERSGLPDVRFPAVWDVQQDATTRP